MQDIPFNIIKGTIVEQELFWTSEPRIEIIITIISVASRLMIFSYVILGVRNILQDVIYHIVEALIDDSFLNRIRGCKEAFLRMRDSDWHVLLRMIFDGKSIVSIKMLIINVIDKLKNKGNYYRR